MEALCPKCGTERTSESCPKCGLVFAKFDPEALEGDVPESLKARWREVSEHWDDEDGHDRFIEQALACSRGDFAARCYRRRGDDAEAAKRLEMIRKQLETVAAGLTEVMSASKGDISAERRSPLATAIMLLIFLLLLGGFSIVFIKVLK